MNRILIWVQIKSHMCQYRNARKSNVYWFENTKILTQQMINKSSNWEATPNIEMLSYLLGDSDLRRKKLEDPKAVEMFWTEFYKSILNKIDEEKGKTSMFVNEEQGKSTKSAQYKKQVFDILHEGKTRFPLSKSELHKIQVEIEDYTMKFDEPSMFKTAPNIIKILIGNDKQSAKDYVKARKLSKEDIELISEFGQYTIEALIVHVLGMVFTIHEYNPIIRVSSLVERLS